MDSDDPDLEAFESNLRARELGRTAALVSNLCPIAADSQWIGVSSKDNAQRDSLCGTSSHRQSDSYDSLDDLENSAEWKFEGYLYFTGCRWSAGETYEDALRAAVEEQYLLTVPVPVHHLKMFTIRRPNPIGNCRHCRFEAMYRQNQRADDSGENG